ncbi:gluconokinase [Geitlerinema splendidum]|nr:gluconokinase [Geitlerinema splendidum]
MSHYIIGIDIGTTSTKAVLFTPQGEAVCKHLVEYPLLTPVPGAAEQDPEEIFNAVVTTIREVMANSGIDPKALLGIGFSSAMHSLIAVNEQGKPLTKSITWADNRSAKWAEQLKQGQGHEIYLRTGTPIHSMSPLCKLIWLKNEHPELFNQAAKFISIKEFVFYQFLQEYAIDYSLAGAMGLLNMQTLDWDAEALEVAGISAEQLSRLVPTTEQFCGMNADLAAKLGILPETPLIIGASDGVLSNLGVGAIAPGIFAVTIGTSGAIRAVVDRPIADPEERLFCYPLTEKYWVVGGAVNNGGLILRWMRDRFADAEVATARQLGQESYDIMMQIAASVPPGANGLIFHPYLMGERSPLWNSQARGSFVGLSMSHTRAHFIRAVLEGILLNLQLVLDALESFVGSAQRIQATGGFARSPLWRQMLADVFNREIAVPESYESSCLGAALLGLLGLGKIEDLEGTAEYMGETYRHSPDPEAVKTYQQMIPLYARLLQALKPEYSALASLQEGFKDNFG